MLIKYKGPYKPERMKEGDAGYDIRTNRDGQVYAGSSRLVGTGLFMAIPEGFVGILKSRSGLAVNGGIDVKAGVIDSNYRGEVKVMLHNRGDLPYSHSNGDRIAQLLVIKAEDAEWSEGELDETDRGQEGFGSTGVK